MVAMAHSLYVSGARRFIPAFYERLFETGDFAEATRAGRHGMFRRQGRVCARGEFPLRDWMVPVLDQKAPLTLGFGGRAAAAEGRDRGGAVALPEEATRERLPYGFIGRDGAIRELERAMRRKPGAVVVHGLGGVGKTTLARGFLEWLADTGGLEHAPLWFSMQEVRSAEFVVNRIGETIFGPQFGAQPMEARLEALVRAMRELPLVVVLDNFESVRGNPGAGVDPNLTEEDQGTLRKLIQGLRGGASKVLITSRGEEEWLGVENRSRVDLPGLEGEERWELCEAILEDLGIRVNRDDPALKGLMDQLGGHPLAMRVVLPKLETKSAGAVADALRRNFDALALGESEEVRRVYATLRLATEGVPEELRPLLVLLACHEGAVDADYFEAMAARVDASWTCDRISVLFETLGRAGLFRELGQRIHTIHPALTGFLRSVVLGKTPAEVRDRWTRGFVDICASLSDEAAPLPLHEQRAFFEAYGSTLWHALAESRRLGMDAQMASLLQGLAIFALNTRSFAAADGLYQQLHEWASRTKQPQAEAMASHQLGVVAHECRDLKTAEQWFHRSLEIKKQLGDEDGTASTFYHLGMVAHQQGDFETAERLYRMSMEISEHLPNKRWAALVYHQLAAIAQQRGDLDSAEKWCNRSLEIEKRFGTAQGLAGAYHLLGVVAQRRGDLKAAERSYRLSLEVSTRHKYEHGIAITCHQLGMVAQERNDFEAAERWYHMSLGTHERLGNKYWGAVTYAQLGLLAAARKQYRVAIEWLAKAGATFVRLNDLHNLTHTISNVADIVHQAPALERESLLRIWTTAELPPVPPELLEGERDGPTNEGSGS